MAMYHDLVTGKGNIDGSIDRDLELLRRIMEAKAKQPIELMLDISGYMGRSARIYFRTWGVYLMIDVESLRYGYGGEAQLNQIAEAVVRQAEEHIRNKDSRLLDEAYRSMASYEPDFSAKQTKTQKTGQEMLMDKTGGKYDSLPKPPVGSFDNPLRVELQKKVDAWLK